MAESTPSRSAESPAHRELKLLALEWVRDRGLRRAACEVRIARSPYRADVAAAGEDGTRTAILECKVSRADYLRDSAPEAGLLETITALRQRVVALQALIGGHRPELRRGEALFPEYDAIEWQGLRHDTYRRLARQLHVAERKQREGTKFARLVRWRSAGELYLVTSGEVLTLDELPAGWGWLERGEAGLVERVPAIPLVLTGLEQERFVRRLESTGRRRAGGVVGAEEGVDPVKTFELRA